jgi:hypothetical protein
LLRENEEQGKNLILPNLLRENEEQGKNLTSLNHAGYLPAVTHVG